MIDPDTQAYLTLKTLQIAEEQMRRGQTLPL